MADHNESAADIELADADNANKPLMDDYADDEHFDRAILKKYTGRSRISITFNVLAALALLALVILLWTYNKDRLTTPKRPNILQSDDPNVRYSEPHFFPEYSSERVTIRYGPFNIPPNTIDNGMKQFMISNYTAPCRNCLITYIHATLEYPDGSSANSHTGLWLHHTMLMNMGKELKRICGKAYRSREQIFAAGNERTVVDLCSGGVSKTGYWLDALEKVLMLVELMNTRTEEQSGMVAITYEYIPYMPRDFQKVTVFWLDVTSSRNLEIAAPADQDIFNLTSVPCKSSIAGKVQSIWLHLHDGGVTLEVFKNGQSICQATPRYGETSEFVSAGSMGEGEAEMRHISTMPGCDVAAETQVGDVWNIRTDYDFTVHRPMINANGSRENLMGLAALYIIEE